MLTGPGITISVDPANVRSFHAKIAGPEGTPYEGGVFELELFLPETYPMDPPKARFLTRIYHPNIDRVGRICLSILKGDWTPALNVRTTVISIQNLLAAPNPDDPLDNNVAKVWVEDNALALKTAAEYTAKYAKPK